MDKLIINGGKMLDGKCEISSSKNAILPIIACCILCSGQVIINKCPKLEDIKKMVEILKKFGAVCYWEEDRLVIDCTNVNSTEVGEEYTNKIRSSIFILGPILGRFKQAKISYPGGCDIGLRPIDLHILGLRQLNIKIIEENGMLICDSSNMKNGEICLDFPSVGATENMIMASVISSGTTIIRNCAREPEIVDLVHFINTLGGKVYGAGSDTIIVEGVKSLHGGEYTPIPDRIVLGTFISAVVATGGKIALTNCNTNHIFAVKEKLMRIGCDIVDSKDEVIIKAYDKNAIHKIETQPYPGFPTDMQPQITAVLSLAKGYSMVVENLFENRFKYTVQLNKMGAKITVKDRIALIKGVKNLHGAIVKAEDLRGGASLIIAALAAQGVSEIQNIEHIDRGYYNIENSINLLGGDIKRIKS